MALGHVFTCPPLRSISGVPKTGCAEDAHRQEGFPRIRPVRGENGAAEGQGVAPSVWSCWERGGGRDSSRDTLTDGRWPLAGSPGGRDSVSLCTAVREAREALLPAGTA